MKKAVLYARVSSDTQQKDRTIESQIEELKKQIRENGDVLVKEYIDDGHSGAKIDRPALDQLRHDLKIDLFDIIYFLNTDRIARDVGFQNIIVTEILRFNKQIIINGKDYIHNPENKFELTILGAVAELERAKIIERITRGKMHHLRQGHLVGGGWNIYGYRYINRTDTAHGALLIHEKEAEVVRYIFKAYTDGLSWSTIIRSLEERGIKTRLGKPNWQPLTLRTIVQSETYAGMKYFNRKTHIKPQSDNPLRKVRYGKRIYRDKSEWIGVRVPAIVSKEIFDKAQVRLEETKNVYRSPRQTRMLSGLMQCGECGRFFISYHRFFRKRTVVNWVPQNTGKIGHKTAYKCSRRHVERVHLKTIDIRKCSNPEVSARVIEPFIFQMVEANMFDPNKLEKFMEYSSDSRDAQAKVTSQLKKMDQDTEKLKKEKRGNLDEYTTGKIDRSAYAEKSRWYDNEVGYIQTQRKELLKEISTLHKQDAVDISIRRFCEAARTQFERVSDSESKRQFLLDYIEKVTYVRNKVFIRGSVPVSIKGSENPSRSNKINFCIEGEITKEWRMKNLKELSTTRI